MRPDLAVPLALAGAGFVSAGVAVVFERRMQRYRRPGVGYWEATMRKDGGWRRGDLFTPEGLGLQRKAARFGWLGAGLWLLAIAAWAVFQVVG